MRRMFSEKQINEMIKSDKEVLEKLVYTEDNQLIFPKGILPLRIYDWNNVPYFFNYESGFIVESDGNQNGDEVYSNDGCVVIDDSPETVLNSKIIQIEYINMDGNILPNLNTYDLYQSGVMPKKIINNSALSTPISPLMFKEGKMYGIFLQSTAYSSVFLTAFCDSQENSLSTLKTSGMVYDEDGNEVFACLIEFQSNAIYFKNDNGNVALMSTDTLTIYEL